MCICSTTATTTAASLRYNEVRTATTTAATILYPCMLLPVVNTSNATTITQRKAVVHCCRMRCYLTLRSLAMTVATSTG
jgi:hypothetical protein